jgi:hypothetical protein
MLAALSADAASEGAAPADVAEALVSAGLAEWDIRDGHRQLSITSAGRARLRREAGSSGVAGEVLHDRGFRAQHLEIEPDLALAGSGAPVLRNAAENPLAWLRGRKSPSGTALIDDASYMAGERLRADLTRAAMLPRVTADWSGASGTGGARGPAEATDAMLAARQRVTKALDAVGSDLAGLLLDVCGFLKGMEQVEKERGWPARSAKVVLGLALARLADHYGYAREVRGPDRSRGVRSWLPHENRPRMP